MVRAAWRIGRPRAPLPPVIRVVGEGGDAVDVSGVWVDILVDWGGMVGLGGECCWVFYSGIGVGID